MMDEEKKKHSRTNDSEALKREVVSEFETGLSTKATLKRKYGIGLYFWNLKQSTYFRVRH